MDLLKTHATRYVILSAWKDVADGNQEVFLVAILMSINGFIRLF